MRKLTLILSGVAIAGLSFLIGQWWGSASASERFMREEMRRWDKLATLDKSMLLGFSARSNNMGSGTYLMDVWFPGLQLPTREIALQCENGQLSVLAFNRSGGSQTLSIVGNVVTGTQEGALYGPDAKYVGLLDGEGMWGRVYGWNPGDQSVGFWRVYPKPKKIGQPAD